MLVRAQNIGWNVGNIDALELSAKAQYYLGKHNLAERIIRDAVKKVAEVEERDNSDLLRIVVLLEGWLRGWGRGDDADKLKREMAELIDLEDFDV